LVRQGGSEWEATLRMDESREKLSSKEEKDSWGLLVATQKDQEKLGNSFEVEFSEVAHKAIEGLILGWGGSSLKPWSRQNDKTGSGWPDRQKA